MTTVKPIFAPQGTSSRRHSYSQILKSSALIGLSSFLNIGLGIVRTKAMALMLGPAGVGVWGMYNSILDLARTVAGMGVSGSAVKQIAEATGTGDARRVAVTVTIVRRLVLALGVIGALLIVVFSHPIAKRSFGNYENAGAVALLGLAVFFTTVSGGQAGLLQGVRRIGDLARTNVWSGVYGTVACILIIYLLNRNGIVLALVGVAALSLLASWWYSRKVQVEPVSLTRQEISAEVVSLLKLGFVWMAASFMMMAVAYLVRNIVLRQMGEAAAGYYQSAWTLGGLYVGFILTSMGADFFPRLSAAAQNHDECNRLVNEQTEIGLLLAGPGIIGTLTFAPLVIHLFYSARFEPAVEILRWICLGMLMRVVSWPMGFVLLAKGARLPYFWSELASNAVQVGLVWVCISSFGLNGTGIAFFGGYLFYWCLIFVIVRMTTGFRWSAANLRVGMLYGVLIAAVFIGGYFLPAWALGLAGAIITLGAGIYSARTLCALVPFERFPRLVQRSLTLVGLVPARADTEPKQTAEIP